MNLARVSENGFRYLIHPNISQEFYLQLEAVNMASLILSVGDAQQPDMFFGNAAGKHTSMVCRANVIEL